MDQQPGRGDGRTLVCAELGGGRASLVSVSFNFINSIIGSGIIGDIFENYCREDDLVTFGRFCFGLSIMTTFPLECFVTREGVLSAIPLIFILPSACFLKLSPGRWFHSEKLLPSVLLLAGGGLVLSGLVLSALFPHSCTHGDEPSYCNASRTAPPG
ncbi:unnamed protein product [Boreogadus saida]